MSPAFAGRMSLMICFRSPIGSCGTATAGIVSAFGRNVGDPYVDYLQIDAPINRGNSGGPTFDIYGRVIGVNSAIFSPNGVSAGIGFRYFTSIGPLRLDLAFPLNPRPSDPFFQFYVSVGQSF